MKNLVFILLIISCSNNHFYKESKVFMDTIFTISIPDKNKEIINDLFNIIQENEDKYFSTFKSSSETYKINNNLKKCSKDYIEIELSEKVKDILIKSKLYSDETNFAFSVNYKTISDYYKNSLNNKIIPDDTKLKKLLLFIKENPYFINKRKLNAKCGIEFGFGAIAKGYTLDELYNYLKKNNIDNFLIDAGGDILSSGTKNKKAWQIKVLNPIDEHNKPFAKCYFNESKIAILSSGSYFRFTELDNVKYSHIINLKTASPHITNIVSISIISENASLADAYATALYTENLNNLLSNFDNYYQTKVGIIIGTTDKVYMNGIAKKYCY